MTPTDLQILANYAAAAAEAMAFTLMRTAHSTFVKETEDFSCGLLTPDGITFASPKGLGATWYVGLDYGSAIRSIPDYKDGDICITNDPYSGYVATHTPDLHIWKPVFHDGEIVCFVAGHVHNTDMGGAVPASLSRTLSEVHQEGIRVPPVKLYEDGVLNRQIVDVLQLNVRAPDQNWGDLNAQVASVNTGERKVREMIERFGVENFKEGIASLMDYAEAQARSIIRSIPDGEYSFSDYADEDSQDGYPVRIALKMTVTGDELVLDFTGSDPQLRSSLNVPTGGRERHALPTLGLIHVFYTLDPQLVLNGAILRPVRCILPEGTVVNPKSPAAVGMRSLTCNVLQQVVFAAFSMAAPDRLPASPAGGQSIMNVRTSTRDGRSVMASIGPVGGGSGGNAWTDGSEGSGANTAFLRNTPVEVTESEVPIRMLRYGIAPDTGGPGKQRGGTGVVMEFQVFAPDTFITARNRDRSRFASWGVCGGHAGANSRFTLNPGRSDARELGNTDIIPASPGDVIRIEGAGGGGYESPLERDVQHVVDDVRRGIVSADAAADSYGVVLRDGVPDEEATHARRAELKGTETGRHFRFNGNRLAFEAVMTSERYDALTRILAAVPVNWRFYLKHRILERMFHPGTPVSDGAHGIVEAYEAIRQRFPDLPPVPDGTGSTTPANSSGE
jgi:N-methylhydantoinase B